MAMRFRQHQVTDLCVSAPSPELRSRLLAELEQARHRNEDTSQLLGISRMPRLLGFDDGVIVPPHEFPLGTPAAAIRSAALERAPLRGEVRVVVVLADFDDKSMQATAEHFNELFFSIDSLETGSVRDYFRDVSGGLVDVVGEVVGPYRMPQTLAWYANNGFGIGRPRGAARARNLAYDALIAADPDVDFGQYDNDNSGYVDAYIVVHAGSGGEQTGNPGDLWSHKWVLQEPYPTDGTHVYGYLTIPEDARIGVSAHELGHLLFGWPDLYDTDGSSEGVGNWCLMGGGSWNNAGDTPAHPSAWFKVQQGWASSASITSRQSLSLPDVKISRDVVRLSPRGLAGPEYFLLENRLRDGFDAYLPGGGLLIWHVDETQPDNTDENHYRIGLKQADGDRSLELGLNRGDGGDPFPGSRNVTNFTAETSPSSRSYTGRDTGVRVTDIALAEDVITLNAQVTGD